MNIKTSLLNLQTHLEHWLVDLPKNRRKQFWIVGSLVLLLVLRLFVPMFWSQPDAKPIETGVVESTTVIRFPIGAPQLAYLKISTAEIHPVPAIEPFTGRVTYDENRTGRVFAPVAGRVIRVFAQTGDVVKQGQPLLLLDAPDYADLAKARSQLNTTRLAHERARALFEADVLARKELEMAANELHQAEADQKRASSRLRFLREDKDGVLLLASAGGVVTERRASPGMEVSPSVETPLLVVSDPFHVWVMAELPESQLGKLKKNDRVAVTVDAYPGQSFAGTVEAVGDVLDPQTRRIVVRCAVPNPDRQLKPEMYARVTAVDGDQMQPKVGNAALVTEGLKTFVFVEKAPGVLEKTEVELSFRGHDSSFVKRGLVGGERVVFAGALLLNAELAGH